MVGFSMPLRDSSYANFCSPDYDAWKRSIYEPPSLVDFLLQPEFHDGIHRIPSGTGTLDVLIHGLHGSAMLRERVCLVCFNGALRNRQETVRPPFFSGLSVAASAKLPLIAISDPSLALDGKLLLGWYAGNSGERGLTAAIASIINAVAEAYGLRLILLGGSGGGFAVLSQACLLRCPATLIVWNPQTSIGEFSPRSVLKYLLVAFPELARDAAEAVFSLSRQEQKVCAKQLLRRTGVLHCLLDTIRSGTVDVLYLQNRHDWHVSSHARPYLGSSNWQRIGATSFKKGKKLALHFGNWGPEHAVPSWELVCRLVAQAARGDSVVGMAAELSASSGSDEYCQFFGADWPDGIEKLRIKVVTFGECLRITVDIPLLASKDGLEYALYYFQNGEKSVIWYQGSPEFEIPAGKADIDAVQVFVRDIFHDIRSAYFKRPFPGV